MEQNGKIVGAVGLTQSSKTTAQFRWFYLEQELRGLGFGRKLMHMTLDFAKKAGYKTVHLWTVNPLHAARHLYTEAGFELKEENDWAVWGPQVKRQQWELNLNHYKSELNS